jgi:hypothetical protein
LIPSSPVSLDLYLNPVANGRAGDCDCCERKACGVGAHQFPLLDGELGDHFRQ